MTSNDPDLFDHARGDLFGPAPAPPAYRPDPDKVRSRLHKILAEAKAAQTLTWEPTTVSLYRTIFPQMAHWLPPEEGAQLCFEFETELTRLHLANLMKPVRGAVNSDVPDLGSNPEHLAGFGRDSLGDH
jgi:hypothetical protein